MLNHSRVQRLCSHSSSAPEADCDLLVLHDDRHRALALAVFEHPLKLSRFFLDVDVLEWNLPLAVILTGSLGVGSGVLAKDEDHSVNCTQFDSL